MQAPELGLFLDECIFKSYNDRWGNDREAQISLSDFQDQVDAFKVRCACEDNLLSGTMLLHLYLHLQPHFSIRVQPWHQKLVLDESAMTQ